ncbi:MAG TPA: hypothetical protein VKT32_07875 [Chthonomonadaceae bacterium]|nr:hypothetical protein [Chthonomonadaceae bacterium]
MSLHLGVITLDITSAVIVLVMLSIIVVAIVFSIPMAIIMTYHKRKMEEIRLKKMGMMTEEVKAEFAALRAEVQALRDTTMQYDLSFDTNLQRMERRIEHLERQTRAQGEQTAPQNTLLGGRG